MKKRRPLLYTILFIALFEKVIFWLGVFTAQDPTAQMDGIWKITYVFTLAAGYAAYWVFSQEPAPAQEPAPRTELQPRPGLARVVPE